MADDSSEHFVLLNQLADEFAARYRSGERPPLQEYIDRHPELADEIREFFPTLVEMEKVKDDRQSPVEQPTAHTLPTLERLGDFQIIREIGRGGMGVVYEAEQVSLGRRVALKVLPKQLLADTKTKRRFEREARAAARLHHTNIVPVFGVGEHEGLPYYVMQFIRGLGLDEVLEELQRLQPGKPGSGSIAGATGGELRVSRKDVSAADVARSLMTGHFAPEANRENDAPARIDATAAHEPSVVADPTPTGDPSSAGRLSDTFSLSSSVVLPGTGRESGQKQLTYWQSVAKIGIQVADALEYAHRQGTLHRDIKPSNLLLDTTGTVWVTDLGLAKANDQQNLTHTGDILGTLRYMPPEAFDGNSDARGDVYALGLTLYELLAFRPAFDEKERNRLIKQVTTAEPERLDRVNREVPRDLVTIVHKAIERDPARRYASAAELEADLKRFLDDEPIHARRQTQLERYWRWARHNPGLATLSGVLAAVLVLVAVASLLAAGYFNRLRQNEAQAAQNERDAREAEAAQRRIAEEKTREAKAYGLVQLALNVDTPKVPPVIREMAEYRQWTDRMLREVPDNSPHRFHASLALVPVDPGQVDYLLDRLLQAEPRGVLPVVRDALAPYQERLQDRLWEAAGRSEPGKQWQRLRAAAALAQYAPDSERWVQVQGAVVNDLLASPADQLTAWKEVLRPARAQLLAPLSAMYRNRSQPVVRSVATEVLAEYAADRPQLLADLLVDADVKQFAVIYPKFKEHDVRGLPLLTARLETSLSPAVPSSDESREKLAKRQVNAAVALLRMNRPEKVWPLLKHSPDLRVRSYLIHALSPLGADANALVKHLHSASDVTIRRALLLSLGEFGEKDFTPEDRKALLPTLQEMYRTATDPGLHAAAEWLLRQWKEGAWLKETNLAWAGDRPKQLQRFQAIARELKKETGKDEARWYVNGQGQTLVIIPGPVEFWMGSRTAEEGRTGGPGGDAELRHWRRIGRSFAIASREVTVEQFLRFRKDHPVDGRVALSGDCPVNPVTWFDAAAYCNWLSEKEGLPGDQWCYEPNEKGEYAEGMKMAPGYLQRTGYRLPTESEWEFACRAGAATRFSFGESEELLPRYAWYRNNSQNRSWPVGSLKPNDLGLFDMHGNDYEWCQETFNPYGNSEDGKATEDMEDIAAITNGTRRLMRGGSFWHPPSVARSADRSGDVPAARNSVFGFRPVRTLPFGSFDRYAAARNAALAAVGQGKEQPPLNDAAKAKLRRQALDWLKAELTDWGKVQPPRVFIARNLWQWQQERALAGIRDQSVLAKLPPEEQKAFTQFWGEVAKSVEPANSTERLEFARIAVLIASNRKDEPSFDNVAKAKLRQQALDWLRAELNGTADRAGKAQIVAAAAPLPGLLEKLAEFAPNDGPFQTELARHYAELGNGPLADAARTKARALFEKQLAKEPENTALAAELADVLLPPDTIRWTVLKPAEMKAQEGATLTALEDNSILVSGPNPVRDVYTLTFRHLPARIQYLRLEVLPHQSLPHNGPGRYPDHGGFHLTTIKAQLDPSSNGSGARSLKLARAFADFSQDGESVDGAIDSDDRTKWGIFPQTGKPHFALFALSEPVTATGGAVLRVTLEFKSEHKHHALGRFRLAVCPDPVAFDREEKRIAAPKPADPWIKLATAYTLNGRNDRAVEYYAKALQADPKLGDDRQAQPRYHAARAAALAAAGPGKDEPPLDEAGKAKLRGQALDWLKAELTAWNKGFNSGPPQDRPALLQTLSNWQQDPDLAGLRDAAALAKLPAEERKEWQALWARVPELRTVVPTSKEQGQTWRYTTEQPAEGWQKADFDDKEWKQGIGGFGTSGTSGAVVHTEWKSADIWLRREFTMPEGKWDDLLLLVHHDDDAEVYLNGVLAVKAPRPLGNYEEMPLSAEARKALKPGKNVLAVHCHQVSGPQYIDVGIVAVKGNPARLALAQIAVDRKRFALATELSAAALGNDPKVGDDRLGQHRARVALLAAAGQANDELPPDDAAKAKLRGQALNWLKPELSWLGKQLERDRSGERARIEVVLFDWQKDGFLAAIRDAAALEKLPADEQKACTQFWGEVTTLLAKAEGAAGNDAFRLPGGGGQSSWMAQDREGRWLAVPMADKVAVFDTRTGELVRTLIGHTGRVFALAFSPDGKFLAGGNTSTQKSTIKVWDLKTGAVTATLEGGVGGFSGVNFSSDGKRLFGLGSGGLQMWDMSGKLVRTFRPSGNTWGMVSPALSWDGKRVVCNDTPRTVKVWEIEGDNPPVTLAGHTSHPMCAAYSHRGKLLATGSNTEVLLWDAGTLTLVKTIATPGGWLAFTPDGKSLLTAPHWDRPLETSVVTRWDLATYEGKPLPPLTGRTGWPVYHLSPDGKRLYSHVGDGPDMEGRIRVYDAATGADVEAFPLQALAKRFPALLRGEDKPADNAERLEFAQIAYDQKQFAFAARLRAEALASDPKLADDLTPHRFNAARAAALAAAGQGKDEPPLDDAAKTRLREQAIDWLKAELNGTADRAGKTQLIAAVALLPGLLEKLAESTPNDGLFQAELARHFAEHGNRPLADAARKRLRAWLEGRLVKEPENTALAAELADLLLVDEHWTVLKPTGMRSTGRATLTLQSDDSILASGNNASGDLYTISAVTHLDRIAAFRLEALPDPSLPSKGPGRHPSGNFQLSAFLLSHVPRDGENNPQPLPIGQAWASFDYKAQDADVAGTIDEKLAKVWHIWGRFGESHSAVFVLKQPTEAGPGQKLVIQLKHKNYNPGINLGRFRLSVSAALPDFDREQKRLGVLKLTDPRLRLSAAYALIGRNDRALEYLSKALQADPKLGDDREAQYRYRAARAALRTAAGPGKDEPPLDNAAKALHRRQALDWLKAELSAWDGLLGSQKQRLPILLALSAWQQDSDLAAIRDAAALAKLPADEQKAFTQLWSDVAELSRKADESADNAERLAFASSAYQRKQFVTATRQWAKALASDRQLGDGRKEQYRYNAACAAALAAAGQAQDEPPVDDAARAKLRAQALDWLTAELKVWDRLVESGPPRDRPTIVRTLSHWQQDSDLVSIRDGEALAKLPAAEQKAFAQLWVDVAAVSKKVAEKPQ
jgi:serine/threonine protein kinase/formylglycine-generating enzyme required for sulfatase activity